MATGINELLEGIGCRVASNDGSVFVLDGFGGKSYLLFVTEHLREDVQGAREKDARRIRELEQALRIIATWATCDAESSDTREKAMGDIVRAAAKALDPRC